MTTNNNDSGRGAGGRFSRGNPGGPGNPYARRAAALRQALMDAVSPDDLRAVVNQLVLQAKQGDIQAIKELLTRLLGPPVASDLIERIEQLEQATGNTPSETTP